MAQDNNKDIFLTINGKELEVSHEVPMHIGETIYDKDGKEVAHYCRHNPNYKKPKWDRHKPVVAGLMKI